MMLIETSIHSHLHLLILTVLNCRKLDVRLEIIIGAHLFPRREQMATEVLLSATQMAKLLDLKTSNADLWLRREIPSVGISSRHIARFDPAKVARIVRARGAK